MTGIRAGTAWARALVAATLGVALAVAPAVVASGDQPLSAVAHAASALGASSAGGASFGAPSNRASSLGRPAGHRAWPAVAKRRLDTPAGAIAFAALVGVALLALLRRGGVSRRVLGPRLAAGSPRGPPHTFST